MLKFGEHRKWVLLFSNSIKYDYFHLKTTRILIEYVGLSDNSD